MASRRANGRYAALYIKRRFRPKRYKIRASITGLDHETHERVRNAKGFRGFRVLSRSSRSKRLPREPSSTCPRIVYFPVCGTLPPAGAPIRPSRPLWKRQNHLAGTANTSLSRLPSACKNKNTDSRTSTDQSSLDCFTLAADIVGRRLSQIKPLRLQKVRFRHPLPHALNPSMS